ncbi:MAG: hypothetical protein IBJ15_01880 [Alphaproteobacteria bacterium]|nr:hypothetical protein [Alphaproteobacteria bacterium]
MILHITNGDIAADKMAAAGIAPVLRWRDVLHDGELPADPTSEAFRAARVAFIVERGWAPEHLVASAFAARDAALALAARSGDEFVLWFEADLYDQFQLLDVLERLRRFGVAADRISAHVVDAWPGIARFAGLGQLSPEDFKTLAAQAPALVDLDFAGRAWAALTGAPPHLAAIARAKIGGALRFVPDAFARWMREFPWTSDGLTLTERRVVDALAQGPASADDLFRAIGQAEMRPWLGDLSFYDRLDALAEMGAIRADGDVYRAGKGKMPSRPWRYDPERDAVVAA